MTSEINTRNQIIELLRTFKKENADKYGIESMALFGSVARGEHNENSDVDLLIKFKSPSPQKLHIRGIFEAGIGGAGAFEFAELSPLLFR